ncbi:RTA-like protein [Penicillium robsamsonii]|uniref:RTA-like protein n=1 Tax=Penicillium robsamsonii TaxID=1792511 RepID=UPI002546611B|nr:RTA-like protein [Penicillium robsamsonii]KAJ5835386.1 RTA-like protein [Penicillium robsamsonii]
MAEGFKLYHYDPSASSAVAFAAVFGLTAAIHIWQLGRNRTWYFIPFIIGGLFEAFGYLARYASAQEAPDFTTKPYIAQSLMLLLAPAFFAASIYMILGRIIRLLDAASCSLVRPSWLTKIFVTGDVLSFFIQSGGGGMLATAKDKSKVNLGNNMIVAGLFVQIIFFGFFIVICLVFHRRMLSTPLHAVGDTQIPWTRYMKVLYTASVLVLVRSIYRVAEYVQGSDGFLQSKEAFIYVFDAALMFACCLLFNFFHPSKILSGYHKTQDESDVELMNQGGYTGYMGQTRYGSPH